MLIANGVLIDVTTIISAEQEIRDKFQSIRQSSDPFSKRSYNELIQTLLFFDNIFISHPMKLDECNFIDFGNKPVLLQKLFKCGLVKPLIMDGTSIMEVKKDEVTYFDWLQKNGESALNELLNNLVFNNSVKRWIGYQKEGVDHSKRINSANGVEQDCFGDFAINYADKYDEDLAYGVAAIIRSLKYRTRARICGLTYQPHPLRSDFILSSAYIDTAREQVNSDTREILDRINEYLDEEQKNLHNRSKIESMRIRVPVFGGFLWQNEELKQARNGDFDSFLDFVINRLLDIRLKLSTVRSKINNIEFEEDIPEIVNELQNCIDEMLKNNIQPYEMSEWLVGKLADNKISSYNNLSEGIFISFSHNNSEQVQKDVKLFKAIDVTYWVDFEKIGAIMRGADGWKHEVKKAIENCNVAVVYISEDVFDSAPCMYEMQNIVEFNKPYVIFLKNITLDRVVQKINESDLNKQKLLKQIFCLSTDEFSKRGYSINAVCKEVENSGGHFLMDNFIIELSKICNTSIDNTKILVNHYLVNY